MTRQRLPVVRGQQFHIENDTYEVETVHGNQAILRNTNPLHRAQIRKIPTRFLERVP